MKWTLAVLLWLPLDPSAATTETAAPPAPDSLAVRAAAELALTEYHVAWQRLWRESETLRRRMKDSEHHVARRDPYVHCHAESPDAMNRRGRYWSPAPGRPTAKAEIEYRADTQYLAIPSRHSRFAVCPTWLLATDVDMAQDESRWRDGALLPDFRATASRARARTLRELDSLSAVLPTDGWITAQRVRLRLDGRDAPAAVATAKSCGAGRWWCSALEGLASWGAGDLTASEAAFTRMREAMPVPARCAWDDVLTLLPEQHGETYGAMTCDDRIAFADRLWWLAHPLLRDPVNERRVAHDVRTTLARIARVMAQDDRRVWEPKRGGDAVEELLLRYGWPSYSGWGGAYLDESHTHYLAFTKDEEARPYTTYEYVLGRVSTIPDWRALQAPFDAEAAAWTILGEDEKRRPSRYWWPQEHLETSRPLVPLGEAQVALFRRQERALVAVGTRLDHPELTPVRAGDAPRDAPRDGAGAVVPVDLLLLASRRAGGVDSIAQHIGPPGDRVALRGLVASEPFLLGVEARCLAPRCADARSREAVRPPPPLAAMRPGEIAISDPAVLALPADGSDADLRVPREELLDLLLAGTRIPREARRIGIYWETYGVAATDTVSLTIRIAADTTLGRLRRLGIALNMAGDPTGSMEVGWREPDIARSTRTLVGPVPVGMRALALDLTQLRAGSYVVEVSLQRGTEPVVRGQRRVVLQ